MESPFLLMKALETELTGKLRHIDVLSLPLAEQKMVHALRQEIMDARLDIRDYELSETREEQLHKAKEARKRVGYLRKAILELSEQNLFGAVDVAQLTAQLELIADRIL